MTDIDLAYLAGFLDGDGSVGYHRRKKCVRASLANNKKEVLEFAKQNFGGYVCKDGAAWGWHIRGSYCCRFIRAILPYLRLKKEVAELALSIQDSLNRRNQRRITDKDIFEIQPLIDKVRKLNSGS